MIVKKLISTICIIAFQLSSCINNSELNIIPIEDNYAKKNGSIPIEGYYYIKNFKNNKETISKMFSILKNTLLKNNRNYILDEIDDVNFEDGVISINKKPNYYFLIETDSYNNYKEITVLGNRKINIYNFQKKNPVQYNLSTDKTITKITFPYKEFNLYALQNFLNIVFFEREKTKEDDGNYSFQLFNKETNKLEAEIIYFNESENDLNNVFKINFP